MNLYSFLDFMVKLMKFFFLPAYLFFRDYILYKPPFKESAKIQVPC